MSWHTIGTHKVGLELGRPKKSEEAALLNWLEAVDKDAPKLKPASNWVQPQYPLFMLYCYPHLQPPVDPRIAEDHRRFGVTALFVMFTHCHVHTFI
jgi:hypothetical protein